MTALYREVMQITRAVVRRAERVSQQLVGRCQRPAVSQQLVGRRQRPAVKLRQRLDITSGLVRRGLGQTRARIVHGNTRITPTRS